MKHLNYLFIVLLLAFWGTKVQASVINETDHFFCGFNTQEEFAQWTLFDLNGTDGNGNNTCWWDSDEKAALFSVGVSFSADEWLISPAISLTGEKKYVAKIYFTSGGSWEKRLKFTMGTDVKVESQNIILKDLPEDIEYEPGDYYVLLDLPEEIAAGTYHFGIYSNTESYCGGIYIRSFEVVEKQDGQVDITFVDKEFPTQKLSNVQASLTGSTYETQNKISDEAGMIHYGNLTPGTYYVDAFVDGYCPKEAEQVIIEANSSTSITIELEKGLTGTITGIVKDENGNAIENAIVKLIGVKDYEAKTDYWGEFSIDRVRRPNTYELSITKDFKVSYVADFDFCEESVTLGDIVLKDLVEAPAHVNAEILESGVFVSWMMPVAEKEFTLGTGNVRGGECAFNSDYSIIGNVFNEPMTVKSVSWVIVEPSADISDELVDVYIFPINKDGTLSTTPIYEAREVPTLYYDYTPDDFEWSEYTLPQPIVAPYGCVVAIGHPKSINVRTDYSGQGGSVVLFSGKNKEWRYVDASSCFLIRAKGYTLTNDLNDPSTQTAAALRIASCKERQTGVNKIQADGFSYTAWRFATKDKENQENWTKIGERIKNLFFIDKEYAQLRQGNYQYALQTVFDNGNKSDIAYSQDLENRLYTEVTYNIYTNTAVDMSEGAIVTMTTLDEAKISYNSVVADNKAVFRNLRKGDYSLVISKEGFTSQTFDWISVDSKDTYEMDVTLELAPIAPFNLTAAQQEGNTDVVLSWNQADILTDDCEEMEDFSINPAGKLGWTYVDADGKQTYGIAQCQESPYPNMHEPKAFMAFNPTATTPNVLEYYQPHSGNKMLVSIALEGDGGANDDYMFSPELSFTSEFTLSFYAASGIYGILGNEEFMVGYTTGEARTDNITWITKDPQAVGGAWTYFSYKMPKAAKHAVIRCVSNQCMFFMLDDITIGSKEPEVFSMTMFNVEIDGEKVATTNERSVLLEKLEEGKHIAKVQTVYPMFDNSKLYSEFTELLFTVETRGTGIDTNNAEILYRYSTETGVITPGNGIKMIEIFDTQGRYCSSCESDETINTKGYNTGIYILKITTEDQVSFSKILVK